MVNLSSAVTTNRHLGRPACETVGHQSERVCLAKDRVRGQRCDMIEKLAMSDDYARGRRDGLRLALSILEAEEAKWEALLGESSSWRTNATRAIRHKAYQVARTRVQTALNRFLPKPGSALPVEVASMIDRAGL